MVLQTFIFENIHTGEEMPIKAFTEELARKLIRRMGYKDTNWEIKGEQG